MSHPVIEGSKLQCDKGTLQTPIQVTSQNFSRIGEKLSATEQEKQANTNIIPFGKCKLKPTSGGYLPCTPSLIKWEQTSPFTIEGKRELTTDSYCMCSTGGKITPLVDGNSSFENIG